MSVVLSAVSLVALPATLFASLFGIAPSTVHQMALLPRTSIVVGGLPLSVEIADQPAARVLGLGERDGLAPGTGMLFVFPEPEPRAFWMKSMQFCLDIVWIEDGIIQGATRNVCPTRVQTDADQPTYASPMPVSYVLELPAGWVDENGFGVGTAVENLPPLSAT